jgi:hypothetical protein
MKPEAKLQSMSSGVATLMAASARPRQCHASKSAHNPFKFYKQRAQKKRRFFLKFQLEQINISWTDSKSRFDWGFVRVFSNELKTRWYRIMTKNCSNLVFAVVYRVIFTPKATPNTNHNSRNQRFSQKPKREERNRERGQNQIKQCSIHKLSTWFDKL